MNFDRKDTFYSGARQEEPKAGGKLDALNKTPITLQK